MAGSTAQASPKADAQASPKAEWRRVVLAAMAVMRRDCARGDVTLEGVASELGVSADALEWVFERLGTSFEGCLEGMRLRPPGRRRRWV